MKLWKKILIVIALILLVSFAISLTAEEETLEIGLSKLPKIILAAATHFPCSH